VNQYAQQAGANGQVDPTLALWVPLVFLAAGILWMYYVLAYKPGGQPIGTLEWFAAKTARRVRQLMPKPSEAA
jgi:lipopolysaccharide export system permease protein